MRNAIGKTVFIFPLLWICALLLTQVPWLRFHDPQKDLKITADWIAQYREQNKRLPWSLADLRLYAKSLGKHFSPYDPFGLRLQYVPLNESAYLLKSFGSDAAENVFGSATDEVVLSGVPDPAQSLSFRTYDQSLPLLYQASFLEGLKASGTSLTARLEVNPQLRTRYLLVQDQAQVSFAMISFHDAVEEFLWLPSGHELIFTAQGSSRYEDGIYYWNLKSGETHNLLSSMKQRYWPKLAAEVPFFLALSHTSSSPPMVYVLAQPARESSLSPRSFYRFKNLYAFNIDGDLGKNPSIQRIPANMEDSSFDYPLDHKALTERQKLDAAREMQKAWHRLPLGGDAETMIDLWQTFCSKYPGSPMLPYGLWWLASIYNDTFRLMKDEGPEEALVIRNYGIEIAEALASFHTAPAYLRAMADHLKKSLLLSSADDYSVSSPAFAP